MKLLEKLTMTDGVSGNEGAVREIIINEIKKYCDDVSVDAMGSIIAHKKGKGRKVMFAAHTDEIGVVATFIDENGFIRFSNVGGIYVKEILYSKVRFSNGITGVIGAEEDEFNKKPSLDKMYIDIGAANRAEAEKCVSVGDMAAFAGDYREQNGVVISKALDDRAGCYILIEAMKRLKKNKNDLYFVFTCQEEVGLRGAKTAAYAVNPEYAVAVDVTDTGDTPEAPKMAVRLHHGAAIKVMDRSVLCHIDVREALLSAAKKAKIPCQLEVLNIGGTDAGAIHLTRTGVKTGAVSLPLRYMHSPSEVASINDINACIELIIAAADEL